MMAIWIPFIPSVLSHLPPLTVSAVIEIAILAIIIYQLLWIVREARAAQFLFWVAFLGLVYYGAEWTGLQTIAWLVGNIFPYIVFAMIVLFQSEIRRGLAHIGRNPFRTGLSSFEARQESEEILMSVGILAAQKTGALIVLQRKIALRTYTESGIPLQARLTHDLLLALFQPRSPTHDGAVIVSKDRVTAAGCFLPLSLNPLWGTQLGTRHRAAVGITEETDAVSIIVSEETGAISVAVSGSIELDIPIERLAQRLSELLGFPSAPPPLPVALQSSRHAIDESSAVRTAGTFQDEA